MNRVNLITGINVKYNKFLQRNIIELCNCGKIILQNEDFEDFKKFSTCFCTDKNL